MNCKDFREIIDSYLSDELLTETNHDVLRHLEACSGCREEIGARRAVRTHLRSAVRNESLYLLNKRFSGDLKANLQNSLTKPRLKRSFYSNNRVWITVAASLLVVVSVGIVFLSQNGSVSTPVVAEQSISISDLPQAHMVNIALGDHEYCAIQHGASKDHPVSLVEESAEYRGMDKVVLPSLRKVLANFELSESHYCKYKEVRFAHLILTRKEKAVSILVANLNGYERLGKERIQRLAAEKYQIARFDTKKKVVFVVSNLEARENFRVSEALFDPIQKHFSKSDDEKLKTTLSMSF